MTDYTFTEDQRRFVERMNGLSLPITYYDRKGKPITVGEYIIMFSDRTYQQLGVAILRGRCVSTVWLGFDLDNNNKHPMIFETLITGKGAEVFERYSTEEEALAGHARLVKEIKDR